MSEYRYCLQGEVDLDSASQLRAELKRGLDKEGASLLVDCSRLTFIDSTGVAVLLEANAKLEADGRHMLLLNVRGGPRVVFESLGLTDLFRYERDGTPSEGAKTKRMPIRSGSLRLI